MTLSRRPLPVILQSETAECGLACLAMVAAAHGNREGLISMRQRFGVGARGCTLNQLIAIATDLGMTSRALRCEIDDLHQLQLPAILHWDFTHFVVLRSLRRSRAVLHDPAVGVVEVSLEALGNHFTGICLELGPGESFEPRARKTVPPLSTLFSGVQALLPFLGQIMLLSLLLQVVALAMPFYVQLVVDDVLVKRDEDLLTLLVLGFLLLTVFSVVTEAVRGYAGIYLTNQLSFILGARLFQHLLRLPAVFFARRQVGDIVSRFGSLKPVQEFITSSSISLILDGVMAVTTLVLMLVYSPLLTAVVVGTLLLYLVLQVALFKPLRSRQHEKIVADAQVETHFIETIRSMSAIKRYGVEAARNSAWQNRFADSINADVRVSRLSLWLQLADSAIIGISHLVVVYLGALIVLAGDMSIGMLYAFLAYRNHLNNAATSLVSELVRYLMLSLHLERLADIQLAETDDLPASPTQSSPLSGAIALRDAGFRYAASEPWLFRATTLKIRSGDKVAIFGPSGIGKSTLMACLQGDQPLAEGELSVDGRPMTAATRVRLRQQSAAVMQEDRLLAGTILSNIAFGEPLPDRQQAERAAALACIHEDIAQMPMGYDSLVGEMGASLSAGQVQRILIARALYRSPTLLLLDEGTAHLDAATERAVMKSLLALDITCVFITHSRAMLSMADRVILPDGSGAWISRRVRRSNAQRPLSQRRAA